VAPSWHVGGVGGKGKNWDFLDKEWKSKNHILFLSWERKIKKKKKRRRRKILSKQKSTVEGGGGIQFFLPWCQAAKGRVDHKNTVTANLNVARTVERKRAVADSALSTKQAMSTKANKSRIRKALYKGGKEKTPNEKSQIDRAKKEKKEGRHRQECGGGRERGKGA